MAKVIKSKNSKKTAPSFVKVKGNSKMETIDEYFNRKADESKKTLDRIGFPEELVPNK